MLKISTPLIDSFIVLDTCYGETILSRLCTEMNSSVEIVHQTTSFEKLVSLPGPSVTKSGWDSQKILGISAGAHGYCALAQDGMGSFLSSGFARAIVSEKEPFLYLDRFFRTVRGETMKLSAISGEMQTPIVTPLINRSSSGESVIVRSDYDAAHLSRTLILEFPSSLSEPTRKQNCEAISAGTENVRKRGPRGGKRARKHEKFSEERKEKSAS